VMLATKEAFEDDKSFARLKVLRRARAVYLMRGQKEMTI